MKLAENRDLPTPRIEVKNFDLASVRDLRALVLEAAVTAKSSYPVELILITPKISKSTIEAAWQQVVELLQPEVASKIYYTLSHGMRDGDMSVFPHHPLNDLRIERPNYTFEVLRIIANANLSRSDGLSITRITELIGCSESPVRRALKILHDADIVRGYACDVPSLTLDLLGRINALPQTVRLRFRQGATPRSTQGLLERAKKALAGDSRWQAMSISGAIAAAWEWPTLDLLGAPRLDLCMSTQRHSIAIDLEHLEALSSELEIEPNPTAPAPIVVSLPRSTADLAREPQLGGLRLASRFDVYLSLLDMGLRPQAVAYAQGTG